ncbi:hypothetical protein JCGZ_06901 [Jatropha curcas]|uniref:Aminotransferase-like plant mobile domain-containing protein n=1 Tax=Jatropha curcas TaxID=180498 RepID=A0A067KRQ9_JATCU|nr:hypothetical protein JCGZ_06901 [Jatropha curcas]
MALPSYSSNEDFLGSLGISLDEVDLMADTDTHASMTGIFAQDSRIKLDVGESSVAGISLEIFDPNSPVGAIIRPSYLGYLRHFDMGRSNCKELLSALAERCWDTTNTFHFSWGELTMTPTDFSVISGIPFRIRRASPAAAGRAGFCYPCFEHFQTLTWAFEYFPYTHPKLLQTDPVSGLAPSAWRWYKSNLHPVRRNKSLKELRAFFYTCPLEQDMRAGKQMTLTVAHTEGIPHLEFIMEGDYDEFCVTSLMPPIGSRLDSIQRSAPSQPLGTRSSRASGPSTRTLRRRPMTEPTSSTPIERSSQAGPSQLAGPSRALRAILEATGLLHPDLVSLRLPYNISYFVPNSPPALREVSLDNVESATLPSENINEVPDGLVNQMMELVLGMQQELAAAWTQIAFDD